MLEIAQLLCTAETENNTLLSRDIRLEMALQHVE